MCQHCSNGFTYINTFNLNPKWWGFTNMVTGAQKVVCEAHRYAAAWLESDPRMPTPGTTALFRIVQLRPVSPLIILLGLLCVKHYASLWEWRKELGKPSALSELIMYYRKVISNQAQDFQVLASPKLLHIQTIFEEYLTMSLRSL